VGAARLGALIARPTEPSLPPAAPQCPHTQLSLLPHQAVSPAQMLPPRFSPPKKSQEGLPGHMALCCRLCTRQPEKGEGWGTGPRLPGPMRPTGRELGVHLRFSSLWPASQSPELVTVTVSLSFPEQTDGAYLGTHQQTLGLGD
jgi:hypothetical protein